MWYKVYSSPAPRKYLLQKTRKSRKADDTGLNHSVFWCENNCFVRLMQFLNKADKKYRVTGINLHADLAFLVAVKLMVFSYNYCPLITNKNQSRYSLEIIIIEFSMGPQFSSMKLISFHKALLTQEMLFIAGIISFPIICCIQLLS